MMTPAQQKAFDIGQKIMALQRRFVTHARYRELEAKFDALLYHRRAGIELGQHHEAHGIAVIGRSGSGKSTAIRRLFSRHSDLQLLADGVVRADVVSLTVPSPATLKHVGHSCLQALGYPIRRDRTSGIIWELVQNHLRQRQTMFLHLDEAQDFYSSRFRSEMQDVVNTLKSIMQNRIWPVGIILSGMPGLMDLFDLDTQLARRIEPIHFAPVSYTSDGKSIRSVVEQYAHAGCLGVEAIILQAETVRRLIHAASDEFGLVIEIIIGAIEEALVAERKTLGLRDFASAFRRRTGCIDGLNPFLSEDFLAINAGKLLSSLEREDRNWRRKREEPA
ncbi:hypothetical protein GCM10016455_22950 [Aliiroseovarius zhejiangensis]|uniref:AAA family ATPase n=1 Tax=Aliiroseovarius zhejiangensis TaxID=1632025 RepID=A0ABQ3J269_9RHOB|nr:TniB family NTP-binding protein [Aliiroseovarius zhejiangensis]GHF01417.1 hypothetical protein GCM10016455_22950 [Aliiroseovarius zhejiangensis]